MRVKRYMKGFLNFTDKWVVVENGRVLYISRNRKACERYVEKHKK